MDDRQSFKNILLEKMQLSEEEPRFEATLVSPETHANTLEFESFFSELHSTVDAVVSDIFGGKTLSKTPYAQAKKTAPPRAKRPERTKLRSQLSTLEAVALEVFIGYGASELIGLELIGESLVKKAYRRLAMEYHPDTNPQARGSAFRELNEAYLVLIRMFKQAA